MPAKKSVDVRGLAESLYPYFLRKCQDGQDSEAASLSISAAETFASAWDEHTKPPEPVEAEGDEGDDGKAGGEN